MRITIERAPVLGWVISHPHRISGLPQIVAHAQDRAEAIRQAETALHRSFPDRVKTVKPMRSGSGSFDLDED